MQSGPNPSHEDSAGPDPAAHASEHTAEEPDELAQPPGPARTERMRRFATRLDSHDSLLSVAARLRRQLPGDHQFGDPLSTAGRRPVEMLGRGVSVLGPERKSVVQELGLASLQVWQSLSEATGRGHGDREMAVLFTDLVGFSSWALQAGDDPALELLRQVGSAVETAIGSREGRITKRLGDGVMATFLSPRGAVEAALDAHARVEEIEIDGYRPRMRAGLHWGSPRRLGGDYLGVDVNIASRVGDAAKPGQVLITEPLLARLDLDGLRASRPKRLRAHGAPRDLHVVRVSRD